MGTRNISTPKSRTNNKLYQVFLIHISIFDLLFHLLLQSLYDFHGLVDHIFGYRIGNMFHIRTCDCFF